GGQSVLADDVAEIRRSGTSRDARLPDGEGDGRVQADHRVVEDLVTGDDGADDTRLLIVTQDDRGIDVIAAVGGGERHGRTVGVDAGGGDRAARHSPDEDRRSASDRYRGLGYGRGDQGGGAGHHRRGGEPRQTSEPHERVLPTSGGCAEVYAPDSVAAGEPPRTTRRPRTAAPVTFPRPRSEWSRTARGRRRCGPRSPRRRARGTTPPPAP